MTSTNAAAVLIVCLVILVVLVCFHVLGRRIAVTGEWGRIGAGGSSNSLVGLGRYGIATREGWGNAVSVGVVGGGGLVCGANATTAVNESGADAGGGDSIDVGSSGESGGGG